MAGFLPKRGCFSCLPGCLLTVVVLAGVGYVWFRQTAPPPVPPPKVVHYTPAQAAHARRHVEAARDALLRPVLALPPGLSRPAKPAAGKKTSLVRVQLSEADLNTFLATDPQIKQKFASRGVEAVQVALLAPDRVQVRAAVLLRNQTQNVQIMGRLLPDADLGVRFQAENVQAGRVALPLTFVSSRADKLMAQLTAHLPVRVRQVKIEHGTLVLTGTRR